MTVRIGIWVIPPLLFFIVRRLCRELQRADRIDEIREAAEREADAEPQPLGPPPAQPAG